jgi:hypothetical protein
MTPELWRIGAEGVASKAAGTAVYKVPENEADIPKQLERSLKILGTTEMLGGRAVRQVVAGRARWWTLGWSPP